MLPIHYHDHIPAQEGGKKSRIGPGSEEENGTKRYEAVVNGLGRNICGMHANAGR